MKNNIVFLFIFFICVNRVTAQQPVFISYPSENYPAVSDRISVLYSNGLDFLWMATDSSLLRFDGIRFFSISSQIGQTPSAITQDLEGIVWTAFGNRIYFIDKTKNKPVPVNIDSLTHPVTALLTVQENLWIATAGGGIVVKTKDNLTLINSASGLSDDYVYCLEIDDAGNVWAGTDQGITILSSKQPFRMLKEISTDNGLPDVIVRRLKKTDDHKMLIGMHQAGVAIADSKQKVYHITPLWLYGEVNDLVTEGPGIWIATEKGGVVFLSFPITQPVSFTKTKTQNFTNVTAAAKTDDGFIWFASGGRLYKTAGMKWAWLNSLNGITLQNIHAVFTDSNNNLWFTPDSGLMVLSADNSVRQLSLPGINSKTDITSFYEDECGHIWIGTVGSGLFRYNIHTGRIYPTAFSQNESEFRNILSLNGKLNTLWVATYGGVFKTSISHCAEEKPKLTIEPVETGQQIGHFYVYHVFIDSKGKTWFATDGNGLICYDDGKIVRFDVAPFSRENVVYSIAEDLKNNLWFSVHNGGLIRFDGNQFRQFTDADGLKSKAVQSVIHDRKNRLVLTYENGIDFFNTETGFVYSPGKEFGFETIKPDLNTLAIDNNSSIWIGTSHGIIKFSSDYSPDSIRPYSVLYEAVLPGSAKLISNRESLNHNENMISLLFCGFWNAAPEQLVYRYKLNNSDAWITTYDRQIVLSGLNPGNHQVIFQASHHPSFLFPSTSSFHFTIMKPIWKRAWFLAILAFALTAFIFTFIRLRENQLRKMEILEKEKTIYQYETLKSQVNPHFLFNSLNTLISVIESEPREEASLFAQQLSGFYRSSLSLRERDFISLREEMETVQTFIQILVKRFGNRMNVKTEINSAELEKKIIPMALQMLIENALKHIAATNDQPLKINIRSEGGYIMVTNNINPKKNPEASTQTGLQNIINRYRHYGREDVEVINDGKMFTVKLPLLKSET